MSSFTEVQGASEICSSYAAHSSLLLKFWVSCRDTGKLNKVEVGNLKVH